jgi:hypothetical protein
MTNQRTEIARKPLLFELPNANDIEISREIRYGQDEQVFDLYRPAAASKSERLPVVIFVFGYRDAGAHEILGCALKDVEAYVTWARLFAANGEPADVRTVLAYIEEHADDLGIDASRIGIWSCSGNVPMATSLLLDGGARAIRAAFLGYGFLFEPDDTGTMVAQSARWGFDYPLVDKTPADLRRDLPLFIVRCGHDEIPHINESIDAFVANALALNLPVTIANHADAPHAFDIAYESPRTRELIGQIVSFFESELSRA